MEVSGSGQLMARSENMLTNNIFSPMIKSICVVSMWLFKDTKIHHHAMYLKDWSSSIKLKWLVSAVILFLLILPSVWIINNILVADQGVDCLKPNLLSSVQFTENQNHTIQNGTMVFLKCENGYSNSNGKDLSALECSNGVWKGAIPLCESIESFDVVN